MTNESPVTQSNLGDLSDYSLQLNRWYLKPIGVWPSSPSTSNHERIVSIILIGVCYCSISFTLIPCILHIILENEDFQIKLRELGPLSHWLVGGINYTTLLLRGKEIRYCVDHIHMDWRVITKAKDQCVMLKHAKFGRYAVAFCAAFMQGGILSHCIVTALSTKTVYVGNETKIVHLLPSPFYKKLLNVDVSPTNEIILASQLLSGFVVTYTAVAAFSLGAVFASHACGQLNILMAWITEYVNESREYNTGAKITKIGVVVEYHLRILRFISRIEDVMSRICFLELFRCTLGICILGYYILMDWPAGNFKNAASSFVLLCSVTFNIFIFCYMGEVLTEQCSKVGEVVYMTDWYYLPHKDILDLIMIISRSSMVFKITAGKLFHMSIYTFADVMKTSFAYLNLLRQTA